MTQTNANLANLIGSRICHDLISPIGAITNGLELLGMTGAVSGPEMGLISESAESAGARIRFFRIAYGASGDQLLGPAEVAAVLRDVARAGKMSYDWQIAEPQPRALVRLAFLAVQCCESAMAYGGTVQIRCDADDWTVTGHSPRLKTDDTLWAGLTGTGAEVTSATVQFALLPLAARDAGRQLHTRIDDETLVLRF